MKRDLIRRLKRAAVDIEALFVTRPMVINILTVYGGSRQKAVSTYDAMVAYYDDYLSKKNLANPGIEGVPNGVAQKYLSMFGITADRIVTDLRNREREETENAGNSEREA